MLKKEHSVDTKSPGLDVVTISAKAGHGRLPAILSILSQTTDWEIVDVKTSSIGAFRNGKKYKQITLTFVAGILEQSETTS